MWDFKNEIKIQNEEKTARVPNKVYLFEVNYTFLQIKIVQINYFSFFSIEIVSRYIVITLKFG